MSDQGLATRKPRSPINPVRLLNELRGEKGLPKVFRKAPVAPGPKKLSKDERLVLAGQVWMDLFPGWNGVDFVVPDHAEKAVVAEYSRRLSNLEGPVAEDQPAGKPRGRRSKSVA